MICLNACTIVVFLLHADDTEIYNSSSDSSNFIAKNNEELENVNQLMTDNKLQFHHTKPKHMFVEFHTVLKTICLY